MLEHVLAMDDLHNCDIGLISGGYDGEFDAPVITDRSPVTIAIHFILTCTAISTSGVS